MQNVKQNKFKLNLVKVKLKPLKVMNPRELRQRKRNLTYLQNCSWNTMDI